MLARTRESQFITKVFPAELREISSRRSTLGITSPDDELTPSLNLGLAGLALSGGGIRSATFGLGVVQALAKHKVMRLVDYLSTVSGGGYIGSCLSSLLNTPHADCDSNFPLRREVGVEEAPGVRHLRNSGHYLAPSGLSDTLRIPTLLLRGILINFAVFLPFILLAVLLTEILYEGFHHIDFLYKWVPWLPFGFFLVLVATFPIVSRLFTKNFQWPRRDWYELLMTKSFAASVLFILLIPIFWTVSYAVETSPEQVDAVWEELLERGPGNYHILFVVIALSAGLMLLAGASKNLSKLSGKIGLYAAGLLGPLFLFSVYLGLCVLQVDSHLINDPDARFSRALDMGSVPPDLAKQFKMRGIIVSSTDPVQGKSPRWVVRYEGGECPVKKEGTTLEIACGDLWDDDGDFLFLTLTFLSLYYSLVFVDVNLTSIHSFYRDRLSKAYLFQTNQDGEIQSNDDQKLSGLNRKGTVAPYHLVNVALNLQGSSDPDLRGRNADFFVFSKCFTGSERMGYCDTAQMEKHHQHLNLGTAMAISGAAAAPNMGVTTIKPLMFIMTLLNIRLGYWLPNPSLFERSSWRGRMYRKVFLRGAGAGYLWKEALGAVDEKGGFVNVSDGGHLENLGVYELLRRHCKLIIAVDGEADPDLSFGSLVRLIRYARIDMGIEIEIDLTELRLGKDNLSRKHWVLATIDYGEQQKGRLLYIKSSITGDESDDIRDYRSRNPVFPHESTADQFFSEDQFEAYRSLGFHIADGIPWEEVHRKSSSSSQKGSGT